VTERGASEKDAYTVYISASPMVAQKSKRIYMEKGIPKTKKSCLHEKV
jgi:hypothetical protein